VAHVKEAPTLVLVPNHSRLEAVLHSVTLKAGSIQ